MIVMSDEKLMKAINKQAEELWGGNNDMFP